MLGIGLDLYTIDFDAASFRGELLSADVIAGGMKTDEARIRAIGHDFERLPLEARGGPAKVSGRSPPLRMSRSDAEQLTAQARRTITGPQLAMDSAGGELWLRGVLECAE